MAIRHRLVYVLLLVSFCFFGSCQVDRTMLVVLGAVPLNSENSCVPSAPASSAEYLSTGIIELAVGETDRDYNFALHITYPFNDTGITPTGSYPNYGTSLTANNVTLEELEFIVESEADWTARLQADTYFDWDTVTETQDPGAVPLSATTRTSSGEDLFAVTTLPLTDLEAPAIVGDKNRIIVHGVVRARTLDGDILESTVFHFPIELCNSCLSSPVCPTGTVAVPAEETPCYPGQDEPLVLCELPETEG